MGDSTLPGLSTASMLTSDGVRLDADVWTPIGGKGPWPVLLMRQAYGRRLGSALCYAHPAWYASHGFLVVIQDVRGRGSSEGLFKAFEHEARDGVEAIAWAASLPGANGRVGLYGFSYQGTNQLLAAAGRPPALGAMAPAMIGWDMATDWASEDGATRLASNVGWGIQMAAGTAQHQCRQDAWDELFAASRSVPVNGCAPGRPPVLERWRSLGHYHDWLEREDGDPYWDAVSPSRHAAALREIATPTLFVAGWFDTHLPGTLAAYDVLAGSGASLLVGPWTHFPWDRCVGDRDFGPDATSPVDRAQVRFFKRWLSGTADDAPDPRLRVFDMGACRWRDAEAWPQAFTVLHLTGSGLASIDNEDGALNPTPVATETVDYIVHDPWRPAPSVGGAFGTPPGPVNRDVVDRRSDVMTFTTKPLETSMALLGSVEAELTLVSDCGAFDIACTLSTIGDDGRVLQIAEGYRSVANHSNGERVRVSLRRTCATLVSGTRLRLSVAAASFPAYPVNPGTGQRPIDAEAADAGLITIGVVTGGGHGSRLRLAESAEQESE